ncbi:MAG: ABC transporter permease, partial [Shewanella sp.]
MKLFDSIADLGRSAIDLVIGFGQAGLMLWGAIFRWPRVRKGLPLLVRQIYVVGVQSMVIILVSGLFIGMVLALQGYNILVGFGTEESLGPMVALSLLRE